MQLLSDSLQLKLYTFPCLFPQVPPLEPDVMVLSPLDNMDKIHTLTDGRAKTEKSDIVCEWLHEAELPSPVKKYPFSPCPIYFLLQP